MCPDGARGSCKTDTFTCMKTWMDLGDDLSVNACNGKQYTFGELDYNSHSLYVPMGSIMVLPGCTAYLFRDSNYKGERLEWDTGSADLIADINCRKVLTGPEAVYNNTWGRGFKDHSLATGPRSFKCRCTQQPISCTPTDSFDVVLTCDNSRGTSPTTCTYSQTIGTQYSSSVSQEMGISVAIEAAMQAEFVGVFSSSLKTSVTTGYNWRHETSQAKSKQVTTTVKATAPAGKTLIIEQAVGRCGGSTVRTEMFRTSHQDRHGNIVLQKVERRGVDGKKEKYASKFMRLLSEIFSEDN